MACGTSEATPLFAGIVALADQVAGHSLGLINPALYAMSAAQAPGLVDVTTGNNTVEFLQNTSCTRCRATTPARAMTWRRGSARSTPPCSFPSWPRPPEADTGGN